MSGYHAGVPSTWPIYHNTFVSPSLSLNLQTPITQHNFVFSNNLCVGPEMLTGARTVEWTAALDGGSFDANGYYPDGGFWFGVVGGVNQTFASFADVSGSGSVEQNGVLLARPIFDSDAVGPADPMEHLRALDVTPTESGGAVDAGLPLRGLNSRHVGAAADLGAIERGCPAPVFGPRAEGVDAETNLVDCGASGEGGSGQGGGAQGGNGSGANGSAGGGTSAGGGGAGADGAGEDGCGCTVPVGSTAWAPGLALALALLGGARRRT